MLKIILIVLVTVCGLMSCVITDEKKKDPVADVKSNSSYQNLDCEYYDRFCTEIVGQLSYTLQEILSAPISHGELYFKYRLEDFQIFLLSKKSSKGPIEVDYDGMFTEEEIAPGTYTLIARLVDSSYYQNTHYYDNDGIEYQIGIVEKYIKVYDGVRTNFDLYNLKRLYIDDNGKIIATGNINTNEGVIDVDSYDDPVVFPEY